MIEIKSTADLKLLQESVELEFKRAGGKDAQGALPGDFWKTYSAFANTQGGVVVLGVAEKNGELTVMGIPNASKVKRELFDCLNNPNKVSQNLLSDAHVQEIVLDGRTIIVVNVPRATRIQRPVYLNSNPLGNTYRRLYEGDRLLSDDDIKRMLAEQLEESRDNRILKGYTIDDLDMETFRSYRQAFANRDPGHPWNTLNDKKFLERLGGMRRNRETGEDELTLAGLLMFGIFTTIQEELPNYMLDYQERPEARTEERWIDRVTLDGKWSGNLFDFYRKVYLKLTGDLKVPFHIEKGERKDETPVHQALREALVNVLVHADYSDKASVLIIKQLDMFEFRNPGLMRIPVEVALQGGESDCRNRTLHKMFRLVGFGEQAGTGIPKILQGWNSQHWNQPKLQESSSPSCQTRLELRMVDLFPEEIIRHLKTKFSGSFETLNPVERLALAIAANEGTVNHEKLRSATREHRVDLTKTLQHLTQLGMLESTGGRRAVYSIFGENKPSPEDVFGASASSSQNLSSSTLNLKPSTPNLKPSTPNLKPSTPNLKPSTPNLSVKRDSHGCLLHHQLLLPMIDDLAVLSPELKQKLYVNGLPARVKLKLSKEVFVEVILNLCAGRYITLRCLAELVSRKPDTLRDQYLSKLVKERRLIYAFPTAPTHELQAYSTAPLK